MRPTAQTKTPLEREADSMTRDGYTPINPKHNAINLILADLGKGDLSGTEVETLCRTAKCVLPTGFIRYDLLPCGCWRYYCGMALGHHQTEHAICLHIGGIEGVKPCAKHTELVNKIKLGN